MSSPPPTTPREPASTTVQGLVAAVGRRVSVRRRVAGGLSDVVGELVEADPTHLVVRRRDGGLVEVAAADFVSGRAIPPPAQRLRSAADVSDLTLERVAAHGWRPTEEGTLGQWRLRAGGGFTGRANSVLPLGDPGLPLAQAEDVVRAWYRERGLTPLVQVPLPLLSRLDEELADLGWVAANPVVVIVGDRSATLLAIEERLAGRPTTGSFTTTVAGLPDEQWMTLYHYRGTALPAAARDVLVNADQPLFVTARDGDGHAVAVARAAVTGQWVGVTAVTVAPAARRQGAATVVMRDVLVEAGRLGARFVYLQVAEENQPARTMYEAMGLTVHHRYHYRRWDD